MNVKLSSFGSSLNSRLKGREVFSILKSDIKIADSIILDFEGISFITLSFGTELFDSLNLIGKDDVKVINANKNVEGLIKFCRGNLKPILA